MHKVGVIGWPVEHSISPAMHNAAFAALGMADWFYDRIAIPPDILGLSLRELSDHEYIGINITVPHKEAALAVTRPDELARAVGAVNTVDFRRNRASTNTDVWGFMSDLAAHGVDVNGRRVLLLGAGGAARAAAYGLSRAGAQLAFANRTPDRATALIKTLQLTADVLPMGTAAAFKPDLIVNCTSAGMFPKSDESPWPEDVPFPAGVTLYDMIYRPARTQLMVQAEAVGGRAIGGLGMLVRQGAAAFQIWTGVEAPLDVMRSAAEQALATADGN